MVLAGLAMGACSDGPGAGPMEPDTAEAELLDVLYWSIQDEFHAEHVYLRVLADHGDILPFRNIVKAEQWHSKALAQLYADRGLAVPASLWTLGNVPSFASPTAACQAAYQAEIANIELYDGYLALALPTDVRTVLENNRAASAERHMPAFQACS
jgi:hypothetical protein